MKQPSSDTGKIARSAGKVSIAVLCSRILGLVREQVFAAFFGAGYAYDAFVVAFRIPNLLRDLFGEGALSAAFLAVFSDYDVNRSRQETLRLVNNVLSAIAILLSLVTLAGIYFAEDIVRLLAADFDQVAGKVELTVLLTSIMFPFLIFISLSAVVMGVLNARDRYFVPAMASSFFNLGSIVGGVALAWLLRQEQGQLNIVGMAMGTLVGGFLQLTWQLPSLWGTGFRLRPRLQLNDPGLRRIFALMVPAVVGLSATQLNIFVNTHFAASCAQGSVSWLNYAFRLVQFPIGLFGVALSIATTPLVSRYAAAKDMAAIRDSFASAMVMNCCLTIPATVGLIVLAEPIIGLIYQRGAFVAGDTVATAEALVMYALGIFAYAAVKILVPVFYALNDTRFPVIASFVAVGSNIVIILLSIDALQHRAIALATSCSMTGSFLLLSVALYRRLHGLPLAYFFVGLAKVLVATLVMFGWLYWLRSWWLLPVTGQATVTQQALSLATAVVSSALLYGFLLYLFRVKEMVVVVQRLRSRMAGGGGE